MGRVGEREGIGQDEAKWVRTANGVCNVGTKSIAQFVVGNFANNTSG